MLPLGRLTAHRRPTSRRSAPIALLTLLVALLLHLALLIPVARAARAAALQPCGSSVTPGTTMACAISAAAEVDSISCLIPCDGISLVKGL